MSDRTYFQLVVYDAPPAELAAFRAAMTTEPPFDPDNPYARSVGDLGTNEINEEAPEVGELTTDAEPLSWGWSECALDAATEYGPLIAAVMPGATFECWADPAYEYPGELYAHAPELGAFVGPCDANGNLTLTAAEILNAVANARSLSGLRDQLRALAGGPWQDAIRTLRPA